MITEDYVSFETAKLLKEKGFDAYCHSHYYPYYEDDTMKNKNYDRYRGTVNIKNKLYYEVYDRKGLMRDHYLCPTLQMAMKWLREVHSLWCEISWEGKGLWCMEVFSLMDEEFIPDSIVHEIKSYEEACESAIKYCLKNLI